MIVFFLFKWKRKEELFIFICLFPFNHPPPFFPFLPQKIGVHSPPNSKNSKKTNLISKEKMNSMSKKKEKEPTKEKKIWKKIYLMMKKKKRGEN